MFNDDKIAELDANVKNLKTQLKSDKKSLMEQLEQDIKDCEKRYRDTETEYNDRIERNKADYNDKIQQVKIKIQEMNEGFKQQFGKLFELFMDGRSSYATMENTHGVLADSIYIYDQKHINALMGDDDFKNIEIDKIAEKDAFLFPETKANYERIKSEIS